MKAFLPIFLCVFLFSSLPCPAAGWNDPQGNLVDLPSEVTVSDLARPRDTLEEKAAYIVEQARIAMRRASQARMLQDEAEQRRRIVEMAAMEQAEAAQEISARVEAQRNRDRKISEIAENERYEARFEGMSEQDKLALQEKKAAEKEEQDRRIYEQAMQERQDQRIRELALQEQQEAQDQRIRKLALQEQQEAQDQRIRKLAMQEQQEAQDQRIRELALQEQREAQDQRIRKLALQEQEEAREQRIKELQQQADLKHQQVSQPAPTGGSDTMAAPTEVRTVSVEEDRIPQAGESSTVVSASPPPEPVAQGQTAAASADEGRPYLIGAGDVLYISVWKDDVLTRNVTVSPDGTISFPLIGTLQAAGKTVAVLKQELERRISPYVPDPVVSLELTQVNSMFVFILGRVNNPGRFALNSRVNVLQALAIAGGLNPYAEKKKIKIIREQEEGTQVFPFNYKDVVRGRRLETNIRLQRGDVILVP